MGTDAVEEATIAQSLSSATEAGGKETSETEPRPKTDASPYEPADVRPKFLPLGISGKLVEVLPLGPFFFMKQHIKQFNLEFQFKNMFGQVDGLTPPSQINLEQFKTTLINASYQYLSAKPSVRMVLTRDHMEALEN
ncbi:hypothetical protein P879_08931 [Paragonimus westermani]|uniref:Uncharacterized protein n=1 Tax=Paragonimus westermani TaxID=34504 RepID=A0A8T0DCJ9_9TREM|nr:hypothetical protein P879_08931 [Paragonimus westermani]